MQNIKSKDKMYESIKIWSKHIMIMHKCINTLKCITFIRHVLRIDNHSWHEERIENIE